MTLKKREADTAGTSVGLTNEVNAMQILHETPKRATSARTSAHFILINGALQRVPDGEYRRWVATHNASNPAGIGDRHMPAFNQTFHETGAEVRK
jgi:hypothetical protein